MFNPRNVPGSRFRSPFSIFGGGLRPRVTSSCSDEPALDGGSCGAAIFALVSNRGEDALAFGRVIGNAQRPGATSTRRKANSHNKFTRQTRSRRLPELPAASVECCLAAPEDPRPEVTNVLVALAERERIISRGNDDSIVLTKADECHEVDSPPARPPSSGTWSGPRRGGSSA